MHCIVGCWRCCCRTRKTWPRNKRSPKYVRGGHVHSFLHLHLLPAFKLSTSWTFTVSFSSEVRYLLPKTFMTFSLESVGSVPMDCSRNLQSHRGVFTTARRDSNASPHLQMEACNLYLGNGILDDPESTTDYNVSDTLVLSVSSKNSL